MSPERLHRLVSVAEMVTWTLLLAGMVLKYVLDVTEVGVRIGGGLHGFAFLAYCFVTVLVAVDQRWRMRDLGLGLFAGVVPYATLAFDRSARARGLLGETWMLLDREPGGPIERLASAFVRHPWPAAGLTVVGLGVVFAGLVAAGPPTQWFA